MKSKRYLILALVVLIPAVICLQARYLDQRYGVRVPVPECPWCEYTTHPDVIYIPLSTSIMRLFAPADPHFLADLLWLRTTYYFGQHLLTDREYPYLLHLLELITDLSPRWIQPYLFGAVILPTETGFPDEGFYFIDKGLEHHPDNWQLWFFKGFYLWEIRNDNIAASEAIHKASLKPNAPIFLTPLAATLATKAGQKELGVRFLEESLKHIDDPNQRRVLLEKLEKMTHVRNSH